MEEDKTEATIMQESTRSVTEQLQNDPQSWHDVKLKSAEASQRIADRFTDYIMYKLRKLINHYVV